MGLAINVLIAVAVVLVLFFIVNWMTGSGAYKLSGMNDGRKEVVINADTLPVNKNTNNYTYSTWIYVNDWNYKFGDEKTILERKDAASGACPAIKLGGIQNNLIISTAVYPADAKDISGAAPISHTCNVPNVPLQKWVNIIASLNGRTMDVYINGKLTRTCVLPGVAKVDQTAPVKVSPNGGFNGWTSSTTYRAFPINPQDAWNIYSEGYGGNWFANLFSKYKLRVSVIEDNISRTSFEL
jgi:hypothetical protein